MKHLQHIMLTLLAVASTLGGASAQGTNDLRQLNHLPLIGSNYKEYGHAINAVEQGDRWLSKNEPRKAIKCYQSALQLADYAGARIGLAFAYVVTGDYSKAVVAYRALFNILGSVGKSRIVQMPFAIALSETGQYDEAWEQYQCAMSVDGKSYLPQPPAIARGQVPSAQFLFAANLAIAERLIDSDNGQAARFARAAMKANPASALPHYYLGKILISDDRFGTRPDLAGAKVAYEKAVRYGHGEVREKAKSDLLYVASELAKAKPASKTVAPPP